MTTRCLREIGHKLSPRSTIHRGTQRHISTNSGNAYIALGSNVGNRIENIEVACRQLDKAGLRVLRTSHLYETKPMYVEDQAPFLNGACEIEVPGSLGPLELLSRLKEIENAMGRKKIIDKGPRNIDLDILLHGHQVWDSEDLSIPHKSMLEREFVLRPLCDLIPDARDPKSSTSTYSEHLASLTQDPTMTSITRLRSDTSLRPHDPKRKTKIMAILNLTPDSFSDGGEQSSDPAQVVSLVQRHIENGASIIDVGGQSTRPQAKWISPEEETTRVIPAIQAIRKAFPRIDISIDTYHHQVAQEAVRNGANIVNDVSFGTLDTEMLSTVGKLGCTYIGMHMRGDPDSMFRLTSYPQGFIPTLAKELLARVQVAEAAGIRRWRMILDPGIGFAKNVKQNLALLRQLPELKKWPGLEGFPWLIGASRKGFIGQITSVIPANERKWGTAAAVSASVQEGADIVRIHDVPEMSQVVQMSDAIWRSWEADKKNKAVKSDV